MTTYQFELKQYLHGVLYADLLEKFKKYYDADDLITRELLETLDNTVNGRKILKTFIIKKFSNPHDFTIAEIEEIFNQ